MSARLRHVTDRELGIRRLRRGGGFAYVDARGRPVRDADTLLRIRSLAIPPAYERVWICRSDDGHLQATGFDARGRKQYRYHPEWRAERDGDKFERMLAFGRALPRIRRRVAADLKLPGLPRDKVLATIVRLLDTTLARVGNEQYARDNGTYGLTTLRTRHAAVNGTRVALAFRGKGKVLHHVALDDPRLAAIVRRLRDLPGQELFQYVDGAGAPHAIGSTDVNDYLREISGGDFTAKDFRTWSATLGALVALERCGAGNRAQAQCAVKAALAEVACRLRNTPAICRKSYVHPRVIECFVAGELAGPGSDRGAPRRLLALLSAAASRAGTSRSPARRAASSRTTLSRRAASRRSDRRAS